MEFEDAEISVMRKIAPRFVLKNDLLLAIVISKIHSLVMVPFLVTVLKVSYFIMILRKCNTIISKRIERCKAYFDH